MILAAFGGPQQEPAPCGITPGPRHAIDREHEGKAPAKAAAAGTREATPVERARAGEDDAMRGAALVAGGEKPAEARRMGLAKRAGPRHRAQGGVQLAAGRFGAIGREQPVLAESAGFQRHPRRRRRGLIARAAQQIGENAPAVGDAALAQAHIELPGAGVVLPQNVAHRVPGGIGPDFHAVADWFAALPRHPVLGGERMQQRQLVQAVDPGQHIAFAALFGIPAIAAQAEHVGHFEAADQMAAQTAPVWGDFFFEALVPGDADAAVDRIGKLPAPSQPHQRQRAHRRQAESGQIGEARLECLAGPRTLFSLACRPALNPPLQDQAAANHRKQARQQNPQRTNPQRENQQVHRAVAEKAQRQRHPKQRHDTPGRQGEQAGKSTQAKHGAQGITIVGCAISHARAFDPRSLRRRNSRLQIRSRPRP